MTSEIPDEHALAAAARRRRIASLGALVLFTIAVAGAVAIAITTFPRGLLVLALVVSGGALILFGLLRRGTLRWVGLVAGAVLLAGLLALVIFGGPLAAQLGVLVALLLAMVLTRIAFRTRVELPEAPRPAHPVLFWNPRSGGGKAEQFRVDVEARERGIEPIQLEPGQDLRELVEKAIADGADALAMAGGDGSQAIVAALAADAGLPYACIPAGTRNHFALDLGVDRNDVVGALDAFVAGRERIVDLAEVNGQVFVNNVSLGLYADAVQREGYRDAKLRTLLDVLPDALGGGTSSSQLHWTGPDGDANASGAALLVSNNVYRLGAVHSGTRPRLDQGVLGLTVMGGPGSHRPWAQWTAEEFEVRSDAGVPAGIDGESVVLDAPLRFAIRPRALQVRIAPQHPGASPSAAMPDTPWKGMRWLMHSAFGSTTEPGAGSSA